VVVHNCQHYRQVDYNSFTCIKKNTGTNTRVCRCINRMRIHIFSRLSLSSRRSHSFYRFPPNSNSSRRCELLCR